MKKQLTAIYTRVSSKQQKEEHTIESQVEVLVSHAKQEGLEIPSGWIFMDQGYSGATLDRPGLDELRDLVREDSVDIVLVYSPDRLARRYVNQLILEEEFSKHNVKLIYLNGSKSQTPEDQLMQHFQGIFAEYERTQILDRSRRGKLYKARQGDKKIIPKAPYGYTSSRENFYAIDEKQAMVVREIFALYTKRKYSLRAIAKHLEEKNVPSPMGRNRWSPTTIAKMLANSAYIGTAHYGKTEKGLGNINRIARYEGLGKVVKPKTPKKYRPQEQWIPISVPSLVSENDFEIAQEQLQLNKAYSRRNTKTPSILQGVLVCGYCGRSYYKRSSGKKSTGKRYTSYYCRSQLNSHLKWCGNQGISQDVLDPLVWESLIRVIRDPDLVKTELKRRVEESPRKGKMEEREKVLQKELKQLQHAQEKLLDAYQETECITLKELKVRMQSLRGREKEVLKESEALKASVLLEEKQSSLQISVEEFSRQIDENAKSLNVEKKQQIVRSLIEEIIIMPGQVTINHVIPLGESLRSPLCSVGGGKPGVTKEGTPGRIKNKSSQELALRSTVNG